MSLKNLLLTACCILLPALAWAQNSTTPVENIRATKIITLQNQLFELQKVSSAQQQEMATLSKGFARLQQSVTTHDQDILRILDALNTANSNSLEQSENLGNDIAQIKKIQQEQQESIQTSLSSLLGQQKELQKKIDDLNSATDTRFKKTTRKLSSVSNTQVSTVKTMQQEISVLKKALAAEQQQVQELEATIITQRQKTLSHLSSLENLNATLSGLQQRSQSELQNIHQSLTQVITYGLLTIAGVALVILGIFLIVRRKTRPAQKTNIPTEPSPTPVHEEDDEIMDWLKQKENDGSA